MDILFAPWRLKYVTTADSRDRNACVFCDALSSDDDRSSLVLWKIQRSFAILNLYPYTSGHGMIVPNRHCSDISDLDDPTITELMCGARRLMGVLRKLYRPHGFNVGINIGEAGGAGIEEHLHLHVVPRWRGDNNMMGVVAQTRVIPEDLSTTFDRIREALDQNEQGNA